MPRNPYPIIEVNPEWVLSSEEMGTKDKFWYRHPSENIEWLFWSAEAHRGPSPLQLVRYAAVSHPDSFLLALQKAGELDRNAVHEAVHRVPEEWMSPSSKEFAVELMVYSQDQLRRIGSE